MKVGGAKRECREGYLEKKVNNMKKCERMKAES